MSGSRLIEMMRQQAIKQIPLGIELATVIQASPFIIRIDNMDIYLEGDDLIICQHLLGNTGSGGDPSHTHQIEPISAGDRLAVQALPGGQQFLIIDKVVINGE